MRARFIAAYAGDATAAALGAGYAPRSAKQQGHRLLKRPDVIEALRERRQQIRKEEALALERVALSAERTLQAIADLAYFDPIDMVHADGSLKNVQEMDRVSRMALQGFKVTSQWVGQGEERRKVVTTEVKLASRAGALDQAARVLGLYAKDNKQQRRDTREMTDEELMARAREIMGVHGRPDDPIQ